MMRAIAAITVLLAGGLAATAQISHEYLTGKVEKVVVQERGSAPVELAAKDAGPSTEGVLYVITVRSGRTRYTGQYTSELEGDYPRTLRPGQKVRFQISDYDIIACDVHAEMSLVHIKDMILHDPKGRLWRLNVDGLPANFNEDLR